MLVFLGVCCLHIRIWLCLVYTLLSRHIFGSNCTKDDGSGVLWTQFSRVNANLPFSSAIVGLCAGTHDIELVGRIVRVVG